MGPRSCMHPARRLHHVVCTHARAGDTLTFAGGYAALSASPAVKVVMTKAEIATSGSTTRLELSLSLGYGAAVPGSTFSISSGIQESDFVVQGSTGAVASPMGSSASFADVAADSRMLVIMLDADAGIRAGGPRARRHACMHIAACTSLHRHAQLVWPAVHHGGSGLGHEGPLRHGLHACMPLCR